MGGQQVGAQAQASSGAGDPEPIRVPMVSLSRSWPEQIRREVMAVHLSASVAIPYAELEAAMKRGKAAFTWKQLRLWIQPKPSSALAEHDSLNLELPLAVLTPIFLARRSAPKARTQRPVSAEIPDIFAARSDAEPAGPAEADAAAVSPAPPAPANSSTLEHRIASSLANTVAQPAARDKVRTPATGSNGKLDQLTTARSSPLPTELVQRACHLTGVSGALLATLDGLIIASQLPPGMRAETAAGFLPEIFNRLSQYTRELKVGEPTQVEMLVGNTPVQIYRTANAYYAILGKASEPLPKLQLTALAARLT
jgi:predicted regulator of Ras-like GTPase activity (Roadblock/LC7/MglB family)